MRDRIQRYVTITIILIVALVILACGGGTTLVSTNNTPALASTIAPTPTLTALQVAQKAAELSVTTTALSEQPTVGWIKVSYNEGTPRVIVANISAVTSTRLDANSAVTVIFEKDGIRLSFVGDCTMVSGCFLNGVRGKDNVNAWQLGFTVNAVSYKYFIYKDGGWHFGQ